MYGSAVVAGGLAGIPSIAGGAALAQTPEAALPASFQESPLLAEQTASGALPPVAERLPANPMVLTPNEEIGTYGQDWNMATSSQGSGLESRTLAYEPLVRWNAGELQFSLNDVIPNVAERWEISEDGTEYTFYIRQGLKWSDGEPFTSGDLMFWYEDVVMNEEISPAGQAWLTVDGESVVVEAPDEYTVVFRFAGPNGLFLQRMSTVLGEQMTAMPAHYLRQFHKTHNPDVVQLAEEEEFADWIALFFARAAWRENPEMPVLYAWTMTTPVGSDPQRFIATRNPYYWKVDTEGNQLPYLDRILFNVITEPEVILLQALNGEIDYVVDYVNELQNKPLFFNNQEAGDFQLFDMSFEQQARTVIALNLTVEDPVKREIFNNKDFRIGLSHAIDRQALIDTIYVGQGEPFQLAPRPESDLYHERLAKQYTEYDVDLANEHLDRVLPEKNGDGIRLAPNGEPFLFQVEFATEFRAEWATILEFTAQYWQAVGIDMRPEPVERSLMYERKEGNQPDATVWEGIGGLATMLDPRWYFPYSLESNYAIPWANWFTQGGLTREIDMENASIPIQEPPEAAKQQMQLFTQIESTVDPEEQNELMRQILDIAADEFYCMGISLTIGGYGAVKNSFHNTLESIVYGWLAQTPAYTNPCQFFETPAEPA
ncbi:MAG: ABC transporter substrate-binding protein [Chloroflexota bacterium]|nr:ABC transporter substrate-binding protein [Chloroflexota bacterium]